MISCKHTVGTRECSESGHLGDLFWSLCYLKTLNDSITLHVDCLDDINYEQLKRVLMLQPYITSVCQYDTQQIDIDLDDCRRCDTSMRLLDSYFDMNNNPRPDRNITWLTSIESESQGIMLYRNCRYRNPAFDWKYYITKNRIDLNECFFVGKHHEYIQFLIECKIKPSELKWHQTDTLYELYEAVCGAEQVICNAGLPYVIAAGLGKCVVLENSNRLNSPFLMLQDVTDRPINMHNVLNRNDSIYYQSYNQKNITTV
jgi:hypothetical protein